MTRDVMSLNANDMSAPGAVGQPDDVKFEDVKLIAAGEQSPEIRAGTVAQSVKHVAPPRMPLFRH